MHCAAAWSYAAQSHIVKLHDGIDAFTTIYTHLIADGRLCVWQQSHTSIVDKYL
jgi:hypothetical protein